MINLIKGIFSFPIRLAIVTGKAMMDDAYMFQAVVGEKQCHQFGVHLFQRAELPSEKFSRQISVYALIEHRKVDEAVRRSVRLQLLLKQTHLCGLSASVQSFYDNKFTFHSFGYVSR